MSKRPRLRWFRRYGGESVDLYTVFAIVNRNGSWTLHGSGADLCAFVGFEDTVEAAKLAVEAKVRDILGIIRWREAVREARKEAAK